jgi:hypothetical protein
MPRASSGIEKVVSAAATRRSHAAASYDAAADAVAMDAGDRHRPHRLDGLGGQPTEVAYAIGADDARFGEGLEIRSRAEGTPRSRQDDHANIGWSSNHRAASTSSRRQAGEREFSRCGRSRTNLRPARRRA